jgi:hypothetical protein
VALRWDTLEELGFLLIPSFQRNIEKLGVPERVATATALCRYWSSVSCLSMKSARSALDVNMDLSAAW